MFRLFAFLFCAAALLPSALSAQETPAAQYQSCMTQARAAPEAALTVAQALGGPAGGHCEAIALMSLHRYGQAAARLRHLAALADKPELRAALLGHAAQALLLDKQPEEAETVLDEAILLRPNDAGLLVDRGVARAEQFRYVDATKDFDQAIILAPGSADGYLFRASALRKIDKLTMALNDVDVALRLAPTSAEALLERGILRRLTGDRYGARADWQAVLQHAPGSVAAKAALKNIHLLDNPPELQPPPEPVPSDAGSDVSD